MGCIFVITLKHCCCGWWFYSSARTNAE